MFNAKVSDEYKTKTTLEVDPLKESLANSQQAIKRGELAQAYRQLNNLLKITHANQTPDAEFEKKINELKFLIETHVFAG